MRVSIDHGETQTGLFARKTHYTVTLKVDFTEEEKHIIKQRRLQKDMVLERGVPSDKDARKFEGMEDVFNLTINTLLTGPDKFAFDTPLEAKAYDAKLRELMPQLKDYIFGNSQIEQKSSSFEL